MKKTGAVLVAAGFSRRMKEFKPMLPFGGTTISIHVVTMMKEAGLDPIVVVTGYKAEQLETHLSFTGVRFIKNERYQETEMFDSIRIGIQAISSECDRIMMMPMDIPAIMPETIHQLLKIDAALIRTTCKGKPGHPVIISKEVIPTICSYKGNQGLRGAIRDSGIPITELEVDDEGIHLDVDTKEEYERLIRWNYSRGEGYPIRPNIQIKLVASEIFFGPGVCQLFELIDQTGSLQEACFRMSLSYSKGSRMVKLAESQLGFPVVRRWTGGNGGGGSVLTEEGRALVKNYRKMEEEAQECTERIYEKYFGKGIKNCIDREADS